MNGSTALLVIDVQLCAFDGKLIPAIFRADDLLDGTAKLIAAARTAEIPVIFLQHCALAGQLYREGTKGWEIHPSIEPKPTEAVVQKRESSAFNGTDLRSVLAEKRIDTVITCGLQSEFCVTNTSIAALELGLNVYVAQDAHSTYSTDDDDASAIIDRQNALLSDRGARVQPTRRLVELLAAD